MAELDPDRIALKFVNEINRHDVGALSAMMAPDFRFVDELGRELRGRDRMSAAWVTYFAEHPEYRVVIRDHLALGTTVALFGTASGTGGGDAIALPPGRRSVPVALRAVVREGHVAEWQVYSESEPANGAGQGPEGPGHA